MWWYNLARNLYSKNFYFYFCRRNASPLLVRCAREIPRNIRAAYYVCRRLRHHSWRKNSRWC
mgnify:CR=1 FL=1